MKPLALWTLRTYKRWISPLLPTSCRYVPTCSEYAIEAVEKFGFLRGGIMAAGRLLRCHPFVKGGYDPVPHVHVNDLIQEHWHPNTLQTTNDERPAT